MKRQHRRDGSAAAAATRGAVAGLIGGLTLTALDRYVAPHLGGEAREREWDQRVGRLVEAAGVRLSDRERTTAGVAAGLAYAAALGALYGLARHRWRSSPAAIGLLDAALVYGASLVSPEPRRTRRGTRRRSARAMRALSSVSLFGTTTAAAYKALSRRAG